MPRLLRRFISLLVLLLAAPAAAVAAWQASLLTCSPGEAIYELYGHTALRLRNSDTGEDWAFNYGIFNFSKPHFVWRFVLGETDYELGVVPFRYFAVSYAADGRSVDEQVLNLRPDEAERLYELLMENYRPENRVYRYNFLYDNCTTRAVAMVERSLDGRLVLPEARDRKTFRDIIHEFSADSPWDKAGQDLLIGAEVDRPIGVRLRLFAPLYAERYLARAQVVRRDGSRALLAQPAERIVDVPAPARSPQPVTPGLVASVALLAAVAACAAEWRRRRVWLWLDAVQMLLRGLMGCVIAVLFFCSAHPAVDSNWLLLLLNPLPLVALPLHAWRVRRGRRDLYHPVAAVVALVFLGLAVAGVQSFPPEMVALALILLIQSVTALAVQLENKRKLHRAARPQGVAPSQLDA